MYTGFLAQLALRGIQRRLVGLELAAGQLPQPAVGDIAVLPQQADAQLASRATTAAPPG